MSSILMVLWWISKVWFGKSKLAGFETFISQEVVTACFQALARPGFNVKDAEQFLMMREIAHLLKHVHLAGGAEFITYLHDMYLPSIGLPTDVVAACIAAFGASTNINRKPLVDFLKLFVAWAPNAAAARRQSGSGV